MREEPHKQEPPPWRDGIAHVRKRPAMYIGSIDELGLHNLVRVAIHSPIHDYMENKNSTVSVTLEADRSITVEDDGPGIPHRIQAEASLTEFEEAFTSLMFNTERTESLKSIVFKGLHGVGTAVVNALSEWLKVEARVPGKAYELTCVRGIPNGPVQESETDEGTGTVLRFKPDPQIFKTTRFIPEVLKALLKDTAIMFPGMNLILNDRTGLESRQWKFCYPNGLLDYVATLHESAMALPRPPLYVHRVVLQIPVPKFASNCKSDLEVEFCFKFGNSNISHVESFVNCERTLGGTHVSGLYEGLIRGINSRIKDAAGSHQHLKLLPRNAELPSLVAVVSVLYEAAQYRGATKEYLGTYEITGIIADIVEEEFLSYARSNPEEVDRIVKRLMQR